MSDVSDCGDSQINVCSAYWSQSLHQIQEVKLCLHVLVFSGGTTVKLKHLVVSQRKERHQTLIKSTNLELFFAVWSTACFFRKSNHLIGSPCTHTRRPPTASSVWSETRLFMVDALQQDLCFIWLLCSLFCSQFLPVLLADSLSVFLQLSVSDVLSLSQYEVLDGYTGRHELSHLCYSTTTCKQFVTTFQTSKCY